MAHGTHIDTDAHTVRHHQLRDLGPAQDAPAEIDQFVLEHAECAIATLAVPIEPGTHGARRREHEVRTPRDVSHAGFMFDRDALFLEPIDDARGIFRDGAHQIGLGVILRFDIDRFDQFFRRQTHVVGRNVEDAGRNARIVILLRLGLAFEHDHRQAELTCAQRCRQAREPRSDTDEVYVFAVHRKPPLSLLCSIHCRRGRACRCPGAHPRSGRNSSHLSRL